MHIGGPVREQMVDVALAIAHHGDHVSVRETVTGHLATLKPATGFLVVRGAFFVGFDLLFRAGLCLTDPPFGTVQHDAIHQADDTAVRGVDPENRMKEQTGMLAVAAQTEPPLVGLLGGKQHIGRVHDRQHMPSGGTLVGLAPRGHQHLVRAYRRVGEEVVEPNGLIAVLGQSVDTKRPFALDGIQQHSPQILPPFIPKSPKRCLVHAMPSCSITDEASSRRTE